MNPLIEKILKHLFELLDGFIHISKNKKKNKKVKRNKKE